MLQSVLLFGMSSSSLKRFTPYTKKKETSSLSVHEELVPTSTTPNNETSRKLQYRQLEILMMNTTVPLNSSCSKEVVVGLNGCDQSFPPEIQIVRRSGFNRFGITLKPCEWYEIMERSGEIIDYFYEEPCEKKYKSLKMKTLVISFQNIYGNKTLVIRRSVSSLVGVYLSDTIAIQKPSWDTLMLSRRCINQAIQDMSELAEKAKHQFEVLSIAVMDHLRATTTLNSTSSDEDIKKPLAVFLNNLEISSLRSIDNCLYLLCYNICLFSIPVFVSRFKLSSFYSSDE